MANHEDLDRVTAGDPDAIVTALTDDFASRHGREPSAVFAAPGRVNLIGEHTDYNGGLCLPMALPHATYAAVAPRSDAWVTMSSRQEPEPFEGDADDLGPGRATGWAAYSAGVVWALREEGIDVPGLDVVVDSRVPVGAGLSSSAALECSVALAGCEVAGVEVDDEVRHRLVEACMRAEAEVAGAPTGGMDQTIALFGTDDHALLLDCRDWSTRQVGWDLGAAGLTLVVVDTRASHSLSDGGYEARREDCERAARDLGVETLRDVEDADAALAALAEDLRPRVRHVLTEIARVEEAVGLIEAGDFGALGRAFNASHASLRDDYQVSCPELDTVVDTAVAHGALGARMTGGGFGGSAIALVGEDDVDAVERAVAAAFADAGWDAPGFLTATPSAGARRLRPR